MLFFIIASQSNNKKLRGSKSFNSNLPVKYVGQHNLFTNLIYGLCNHLINQTVHMIIVNFNRSVESCCASGLVKLFFSTLNTILDEVADHC